jgi:hypothetical protein
MTTIALQRTRNGLPASAEGATIQIISQAGATILAPTSVIPSSPGAYSYQTDSLVPGSYTIVWTFTNAGFPNDVITRVITLDAPTGRTDGVTLQEIEQAVARTVGPYARFKAITGSTVSRLAATRLKSAAPLGSYEDQFMLRRGRTYDTDAWLSIYDPTDRTRLVLTYDATLGYLSNDNQWVNAPDAANGEAVEVMYLEPDQELRPAVLDGLARCFFWDTLTIQTTGGGANKLNVSAAAPWITSVRQIKTLGYNATSALFAPTPLTWFRPFQQGKDIWVWTDGMMAGNYIMDVLRPVKTLVNNETSFVGPNDDLDILYVDKNYALWAGVLALWQTVPERIMPLIHEGLRPDQKAAAAQFTKFSLAVANQIPDKVMIKYGALDITQIGNAPEPVT